LDSSMLIKTSDIDSIKPFLTKLHLPSRDSHKGQNGKVMLIGGSHLFHSAIIWPAEVASYFVDMVHVASTKENNTIINSIKKKWRNGIVIPQIQIDEYIREDDAILLGTGMMREEKKQVVGPEPKDLNSILDNKNEGKKTFELTQYLLKRFPEKKWVIDAGSLQMMDVVWLMNLRTKPILTPHQKEFTSLFGEHIVDYDRDKKQETVRKYALKYKCIILLKAGYDIISDGESTFVVEGGNAGLTKGGTGDVLSGIIVSFFAKNDPLVSCLLASYLLKKTSEILYEKKAFWYNNSDIIPRLPEVLNTLIRQCKLNI